MNGSRAHRGRHWPWKYRYQILTKTTRRYLRRESRHTTWLWSTSPTSDHCTYTSLKRYYLNYAGRCLALTFWKRYGLILRRCRPVLPSPFVWRSGADRYASQAHRLPRFRPHILKLPYQEYYGHPVRHPHTYLHPK